MALTQNSAVIDFGQQADKITVKLQIANCPVSASTGDFTVQVIITDTRPNGQIHDTGPVAPTTVR